MLFFLYFGMILSIEIESEHTFKVRLVGLDGRLSDELDVIEKVRSETPLFWLHEFTDSGKKWLHDWIVKASETSANSDGFLSIVAQLDAVLPAMAVSILLLVGGSLMTPPPPREKWEPFAAE